MEITIIIDYLIISIIASVAINSILRNYTKTNNIWVKHSAVISTEPFLSSSSGTYCLTAFNTKIKGITANKLYWNK